ncbi:hypothetical protein CGRA01v4_05432 [Colletotrichum graminicola]|uniref:Uncharacterized protein n=1 Tax=Colletotrichum graminicola (strain M1.001 / M2 / FGSC 10212) TaxID=645133 RepID=E3Q672_COLGM|nr:uncharacterized protein GLRG_01464 [Colletotrichum graminicola M1.001]EFQ26320.1 hypothetical protein GLRG_01464 [Colletotrichum graminicola M1.001]WDK14151.1 hypothetical protein CGRA01v4_05432 [Colletotrichum graminicola]
MGLFKSPNQSPAPGALPRSQTGQSIRGKISGPIPIPSPSDDEFPMRNPGTGIATTLAAAADMKEQQLLPPQAEPRAGSIVSVAQPEVTPAPRTDSVVAPARSARSRSASPPASATHGNSPQSQRRTNISSNLRYSAVSASSGQTGESRDRPQRKKSTLRGALGKLFGRKKKTGSQGSADSQRISTYNNASNQHKSQDLSALSRVTEAEPKRSVSLPITEYDRALRSHSIGPHDITVIESARNSISVDLSVLGHRRAATATTSQIYSAPFRGREGEFSGLSPRPASSHVRGSRLFADNDDPEAIGRAITSDVGQKRRSRSLSGLQSTEIRADLRRRSDEIRYWRESYVPTFIASPTSSNPPDHEHQFAGVGSEGMPDSPVEQGQQQVHTPPQPFSFGNLTHMNVMAGMKITQAASIETRIDTLEERMHRMEDVVTRLCNSVPGFQVYANPPRRPAPSIPDSNPSSQTTTTTAVNPVLQQVLRQDAYASSYGSSAHSKEPRTSFGEAPTHVGSLQFPASMNRPMSNSTLRGVTSLPAISHLETSRATGTFTADHYTTLLTLLETERASRKALESQVKKLTRRVNILSGPVGPGRISLQMEPPPTAKSFGSVSAFDQDSSDDDAFSRNRRFLAEDSGVGTGLGDDDSYSEVFATPKEEYPYGYGAFGEELHDEIEDPQRKKAARTLSLSQMTLSKKTSNTAVRI